MGSSNAIVIRCDDDDVGFVLDQHDQLEFYSASLLEQQFA